MNGSETGGPRRRRRGRGPGRAAPPYIDTPPPPVGSPCRGPEDHLSNVGPTGTRLSEYKRSLIETAVLTTLLQENSHGYALIERVQQLVGTQIYVDPGSVYRVLRMLEEAGMVSSTWEAGAAGPQRRTYAVEPPGRDLLDSWADALETNGNALLKLSRLAREQLE